MYHEEKCCVNGLGLTNRDILIEVHFRVIRFVQVFYEENRRDRLSSREREIGKGKGKDRNTEQHTVGSTLENHKRNLCIRASMIQDS